MNLMRWEPFEAMDAMINRFPFFGFGRNNNRRGGGDSRPVHIKLMARALGVGNVSHRFVALQTRERAEDPSERPSRRRDECQHIVGDEPGSPSRSGSSCVG